MDYNHFIPQSFGNFGYDVVYHPGCLQAPYLNCWQIDFPQVNWTERTVVIMHAQDFLTVSQGRCFELDAIESHFGITSHRVVVLHWNRDLDAIYHGPLKLIYFPSHSMNFINGVKKRTSEWQDVISACRDQHQWQCLNGLPKPHRRRAVGALPDSGIVSLGKEITLDRFGYDRYDYDNVQNWINLLPVYQSCSVNIVTESIYDFSPGIISEKTLQAWLSLQVPVIVGHQGIVQQCRDMGFDMFDDVVDNSYDLLEDHQRVEQAISLNRRIIDHGINGIEDRLLANQHRVLETWPQSITDSYFQQMISIHKNLSRP